MPVRNHPEIILDKFFGLFDRGESFEGPSDHFSSVNNMQPFGSQSFGHRYGIDRYQNVVGPLGNVVRIYNYITQGGSTLLVLTYDGVNGKIYHVVDSTTVYGPVLTIAGMEDFAFVAYAGRAFISPFASFTVGALHIEKGLQNEFVYVYMGNGTAARKAAGATPAGTLTVSNGAAGHTDNGIHVFAVVGETDSGFLSAPIAFKDFITSAALSVSFAAIPTFVGAQWTKRHIVCTKKLATYNGDTNQSYFFIPNATVNDNVTVVLNNISFYDADLLEDASYLLDNYSSIPAGAVMGMYHNRMIIAATYTDISLALVSTEGEPEAISQIDGLIVVPLDGNPITNAQELRDILYLFKRNRTVSYVDNGDVPSSWQLTWVDQAIGSPVHGIATVIDSGSATVDYLIIASGKGIILFNGTYILPELSWKIANFWLSQNFNLSRYIQIINDPIDQIIYCTLPDRTLLVGNYANGLDPKNVRWWPWTADVKFNTIAFVNINDLVFGAEGIAL